MYSYVYEYLVSIQRLTAPFSIIERHPARARAPRRARARARGRWPLALLRIRRRMRVMKLRGTATTAALFMLSGSALLTCLGLASGCDLSGHWTYTPECGHDYNW